MKFAIATALLCCLNLSSSFCNAADSAAAQWPARNSRVICGGMVDGENIDMNVVLPNELLRGETASGRLLIYIDLRKPGQVHFAINESIGDEDYAKRDAMLEKLPPAEAAFIKAISGPRQTELYVGIFDGYAHMRVDTGKKSVSISCQEIRNESRFPEL